MVFCAESKAFLHPKNPPVKAGVRTNPACSETKFLAHQKHFAFLSALGRGRTPAADFYDIKFKVLLRRV